ncbi:MAG: cation-translocating P-type ATPase [Gammaproteobacteria bacterium]|nr:cation-translocating P-type ATPase [Gammaproteobacteria bacterium]
MTPPSTRREVLVVEGMFCASCAAAVEALLNRQPGVIAASTHFAADAAVVEWNEQITSLDTLRTAVARLGYTVRTLSEPADAAQQRELRLGARLAVAVFSGMWAMFAVAGLYFGEPSASVAYGLALSAGVLSLPALLWSGWPFYVAGWRTLRVRAPGLDALILLGVLLSVLLSVIALAAERSEVYFDTALMLVTFQLIARIVDRRVRADAARRVRALLETGEGPVQRVNASGQIESIAATEVRQGDRLQLSIGDTLRVDGDLAEGQLWVDRSRLTGEAEPVALDPQHPVWAGDRLIGGQGVMVATNLIGARRLDQLASQVRRLLTEKPAWQRQVDRYARRLLPIAALAAALGATLALALGQDATPFDAAVRALAVFVIACPCALALAVPLAATRAVSVAASQGWLFRDVEAIQQFRIPDVVLLDKTGTVTEGRPVVVASHRAPGIEVNELHRIAATAARASPHPLAQALARLTAPSPNEGGGEDVPGQGLIWNDAAGETLIGSRSWLATLGHTIPAPQSTRTESHLVFNQHWLGSFEFEDAIRASAPAAVQALQKLGCRIALISGDREAVVADVARVLDTEHASAQSPEAKLERVEALRAQNQRVAFCGDGVNDGPALAAADFGIAVAGATGAAQAAASISLLGGGIEQLPRIFALLRRTRAVMRQNLFWALAYNAAAMPLAMAGIVHPAMAALAMSLSSLTVLINTARVRA